MRWESWRPYSRSKVLVGSTELITGSIAVFSARFIDPAWGFAMAWNYALCWLVIFPFELLCGGYVMSYWVPHETVPIPVWITIFFFFIVAINLFGVLGYGEGEYIFSCIKVTAVCIFIILGIVIDAGGSPSGKVYGTTYWRDPGMSL
jgi:amino acid transporter